MHMVLVATFGKLVSKVFAVHLGTWGSYTGPNGPLLVLCGGTHLSDNLFQIYWQNYF